MAEPKKQWQITIGGGEPRWVSGEELDARLADDPKELIEIIKGGESVYQNSEKDWVKGKLSAQQLRNRKGLGEENILFGADDPKREIYRQDELRRTNQALAERYQALVAIRNGVPLIQLMENKAVGKEDATKARQELISSSPGTHMLSQLGFFIGAGVAGKTLLRGTALDGIIMAQRSTVFGKTTQLVAEDAVFSSYLYGNHILNNDLPFIEDDWAGEVAKGLLFVSPFIASYPVRALGAKGLGAAVKYSAQGAAAGAVAGAGGLSRGLSRAADLSVGAGAPGRWDPPSRNCSNELQGCAYSGEYLERSGQLAEETKIDAIDDAVLKAQKNRLKRGNQSTRLNGLRLGAEQRRNVGVV